MFSVERQNARVSQTHAQSQKKGRCALPKALRSFWFREGNVLALSAHRLLLLCSPTAVGSCNDSLSSCNRGQTEIDRQTEYPRASRPGPDGDQPGQVASKVTWTGLQRLIFPHWTLVFDAQKRLKDGRASDR